MRAKLFGVLSRFELDGRWECRGDGVGDVWRDGEVDEGRRRYLMETEISEVIRRYLRGDGDI